MKTFILPPGQYMITDPLFIFGDAEHWSRIEFGRSSHMDLNELVTPEEVMTYDDFMTQMKPALLSQHYFVYGQEEMWGAAVCSDPYSEVFSECTWMGFSSTKVLMNSCSGFLCITKLTQKKKDQCKKNRMYIQETLRLTQNEPFEVSFFDDKLMFNGIIINKRPPPS
jgi:hypothetical protein